MRVRVCFNIRVVVPNRRNAAPMRIALFVTWALVCSLALTSRAQAKAVESRDGNIWISDPKGPPKQITDYGNDFSPAFSPDGSRIVFVRNPAGDRAYNDLTRSGPATEVMQLWVALVDGSQAPQLVLNSPAEVKGRQFSGFYTPQFSGDRKDIFFLIRFVASSGAIVRLAIGTKELLYVADAREFSVIPKGQYQGDLIVEQHRPELTAGHRDWFYLLQPDGTKISTIGEKKRDVEYFLATYLGGDRYVGELNECAHWNSPDWLTCINQVR